MSDEIFTMSFPTPEALILYAKEQVFLKYTEGEWDWKSLCFLVLEYCTFVQQHDLPAYRGQFWIYDPKMRKFPEHEFKLSLQSFFATKSLWRSPFMKNLKHEHLRVLFFIAALRYTRLQKPQQQIKFQKGSQSEGGIFDLFLFHRHQSNPAFALQIRLLTHDDLNWQGHILSSYRGTELLGRGIQTFNQYVNSSKHTLISSIIALEASKNRLQSFMSVFSQQPREERKTQGCVVLVTPDQMKWIDCGFYSEGLTSELVNEPQTSHNLSLSVSSSRHSHHHNPHHFSSQNQQYEENLLAQNSQDMNSQLFLRPLPKSQPQVWEDNHSVVSWTSKNANYSQIPSRAPSVCCSENHNSIQTISSSKQNQSFHTNWFEHNPPHFHQIATQPAMLPNFIQNLVSPHTQHGPIYQSQPQVILVIADPNVMAHYQNPSNYPEDFEDQRSSGIRRRDINAWKPKSSRSSGVSRHY